MAAIYWLDDPACQDPLRVGGKAANLGRLAGRYPVPPGYCLAATCADCEGLPPAVRAELEAAYVCLGRRCSTPEPRVAVRSSAIDEDGRHASFAGQYETYLNIVGPDAVIAAVQRCLDSARGERARHYRRAHGLGETAAIAVLVQQLVLADVSAVVFSADPRTNRRDHVVINATWGLGESLVGGTVTPDLYVVHKSSLEILSRQIAEKAVMTIARPEEGTNEVAVPHCLRREPALSDAQVVALANLACTLEAGEGGPVDLECAYRGRRLYLLQCRPITTFVGAG